MARTPKKKIATLQRIFPTHKVRTPRQNKSMFFKNFTQLGSAISD
jgi:hypothetical protein